MMENRLPSPKPLLSAAENVLNMDMESLLSSQTTDLEKLQKLINDSKHLSVLLDSELLAFEASGKIAAEFNKLAEAPRNIETIKTITELLRIIQELPVHLNLWESQNIAFKIAQNQYQTLKAKDDDASKAWVAAFTELSKLIGIRLT
jgi:hypothetical protein